MSALDPQLIEAYRTTRYEVRDEKGSRLSFAVGCASAQIDALLRRHASTQAAFLSAGNPLGRRLDQARNARLHAALEARVRVAGHRSLSARGVPAQGEDWQPEPGLFVLDMDFRIASTWMREFEQNAYLHLRLGEGPELVLLR